MRSLNADSFRPTVVGLIMAMGLLIAWAAWFFLARITVYEAGEIAALTQEGTISAKFSEEAVGRIERGQPALLKFEATAEGQAPPYPAVVVAIADSEQEGQVQVEFYPLADIRPAIAGQERPRGLVEIEIEQVSPAVLVLRASGQFLDTPPLSLSPQESSE